MSRKTLLSALLVLLAIPGLLLAGMAIWGAFLPREHTSRVSESVAGAPDAVYAAVTDVDAFPEWRKDLERVEIVERRGDVVRFREYGTHGPMEFELRPLDERRVESRIVGDEQGFGGVWTYELAPDGDRTRVTITEEGYVDNVIFRFLSKYAFGHDATQREYLASLATRFE
jgi:hypothetical protein